jgi:hypothetical protein
MKSVEIYVYHKHGFTKELRSYFIMSNTTYSFFIEFSSILINLSKFSYEVSLVHTSFKDLLCFWLLGHLREWVRFPVHFIRGVDIPFPHALTDSGRISLGWVKVKYNSS